MSVDLKTLTPDTTINDSAVLFGADSQASGTPSVYAVSTLRTHIVGTANTFTQPQIVSVSSSSDALRITQTGAGNALVVEDEANPDSTPFVVDASGRVGIGTTTPTNPLSVVSAANGVARFQGGSATFVDVTDGTGTLRFQSTSAASFVTAVTAVPMVFNTTNIERMRITNAGRVGIGTTAPNVSLEVFGGSVRSAAATGGSYAQLNGGNVDGANIQLNRAGSATQNAFLGQFQGSLFLKNLDSGPIVFTNTTSDTERMRITSTGNVCIGTTAAGTSAEEVLAIGTGVAPTTGPADTIQIYSTDLSAGNTILSLYTEGTPVNANTTAAATHRIAVRINGTVYYLLANTAA